MAVPQEWSLFFACREFLAYFFVVFDGFAGGKIFHLEELPDLDIALFVGTEGSGNFPGPFDSFLARLHVNNPVACNQFLGLCEGTIND